MSAPHTPEDQDAHLRAALRHAPDAELAAPPTLSREILAAATRATAPARASAGRSFWAWLLHTPLAGGLAGLMLGVLVAWMWWAQTGSDTPERAAAPADAGTTVAAAPVAPAPPPPRAAPTPHGATPAESPRAPRAVAPSTVAAAPTARPRAPEGLNEERAKVAAAPAPVAAGPGSSDADTRAEEAVALQRERRAAARVADTAPPSEPVAAAAPPAAAMAPPPATAAASTAAARAPAGPARALESRPEVAPALAWVARWQHQVGAAPARWSAELSLDRRRPKAVDAQRALSTLQQALEQPVWKTVRVIAPSASLSLQGPEGQTARLTLLWDGLELQEGDGTPVRVGFPAHGAGGEAEGLYQQLKAFYYSR
jgi:hypothetical protein